MCQLGTLFLLLLLLTGSVFSGGVEKVITTKPKTTKKPERTEVVDKDRGYCFEFTWLGPSYDNTVKFESTCEDFLIERNNQENGLCRQPFVITNNSRVPQMKALYDHKIYKSRVIRPAKRGEVCAKVSYKFNEEIMNITYLRTKIFAENEGPVTSGCYTQEHGSTTAELCVCVPPIGPFFPCNAGNLSKLPPALHLSSITALACTLAWWLI